MHKRFPLVAALFLVSGATGLLYEVAFSKLLAYVFGATAYAVSAVLAAFMGGLALGAYVGGRYAAKIDRPLMAYGVLESLVGLMCAVSPLVLEVVTTAYVSLARSSPGSLATITIARAGLTALVVVIPTVAMGATLPLLSRVVAGQEGKTSAEKIEGGRRLAVLYAINTGGGALGALASAYVILPWVGVRGTMRGAAIANVIIGAIAFFVGRNDAPAHVVKDAHGEGEGGYREDRLLLGLAFASGFLVFAAEVIETHLLALLIGNSAYAFGLMLAIFLVCLALGAARAPAFARAKGEAALPRGLAIAALSVAVSLLFWDQLPRFFTAAGKVIGSWGGRELCRAGAAFAILAVPTYWMGTTFPLLLAKVASRKDVARAVGRLTVANTVGTIVGSIVTGYAILPALGSQGGLRAVAIAFAIASLVAARYGGSAPEVGLQGKRDLVLSALAMVVAMALPRWDLARLTSGANVYFTVGPPPDEILFVQEDVHGGVTTVTKRGGVTTMYTNGKFQGDDGAEMAAQRRFAHFPSLFVRKFDRTLVIGLGTGTTLGTIAAYPWAKIDVAEISPAIVDAAKRFFGPQGAKALSDGRVALDLNDGRNVLLVSNAPYDLVTIELTSVWFAGASSLYSREFYELVKARLSSDGVLQQWVQLHHIRREELASIVRTLRSVFPHVALFVGGSQGILVASAAPLVASKARLATLDARPALAETLGGKKLVSLFDELSASEEDLDKLVAETTPVPVLSTDDNLYLEYATPKGNVMSYGASLDATLGLLGRYRTKGVLEKHLAE